MGAFFLLAFFKIVWNIPHCVEYSTQYPAMGRELISRTGTMGTVRMKKVKPNEAVASAFI